VAVPDVRFADSDGVAIAWTQWGSGPDLLVVSPLVSNVEIVWEHEIYRRFLEYMGRHLRMTNFDKRGMGISDRFDGQPTLEQRTGDILAVDGRRRPREAGPHGPVGGRVDCTAVRSMHPDRVEPAVAGQLVPRDVRFRGRAPRSRRIIRALLRKATHVRKAR